MKSLSIILILLLSSVLSFSQNFIGGWTSYLPYNKAIKLALTSDKVYCATDGGLFYYNKIDNSLNKFSKENGLSDSDISTIAYSESTNILIIAYNNANLDLISGNTIFNLSDIKKKPILGDKNIYSIYFLNDRAYLACGFGIVVIDLIKKEIKETYKIGHLGEQIKINTITSDNQYLYAGTDEGLYMADLDSPNLLNFEYWHKDPQFSHSGDIIGSLINKNGSIYLSRLNTSSGQDSIYYNKIGTWEPYPYFQSEQIQSLNKFDDRFIICSKYNVDVFDDSGNVLKHLYTGRPACGNYDQSDVFWVADKIVGLIKNPGSWEIINLVPEGPADGIVANMTFRNGKLLAVAGGTTSSWNNLYMKAQVYEFENKKWTNWKNDSIRDLINIIIDPLDNNHYFAASWGYGLLEFKNGELQEIYRDHNSTLQTIIPNGKFFRLSGMDYDKDGNLWVANSGVAEPLSVLNTDGEWFSFPIASAVNAENMIDIIITESDHKWIALQGGNGLFVFDDKGTWENDDDDEYVKLSIVDKDGGIITNEVYSIAEDRDGNIWVGTNQGPLIYYSPYQVFSDDLFYAQQIIVPRNDGSGLGDPLLGTESITTIEIDGANRKWLGTKDGGVFLVSEDGFDQIFEFNTENSPLLSNSIMDIEINDETGEVFFGTDGGIISFISDATQPSEIFEDVYVFPNPVRESYMGDVVIKGLVENTNVKITDINGNIVHESKSLGGQALWDGKNYNNDRVATGVYLVFCTTEDGLQTFVTKLLFIH